MSGLKAPLHGRTHLPGGSDPITPFGSGIQFDTDPQEGGYLHVSTTGFDSTDSNAAGIGFYATGGNNPVILGTEDDGWIQLLFNQTGANSGEREIRLTDQRILMYTINTSIDMFDGASAALSDINFVAGTASMDLAGTGGLDLKVPTAGGFTVKNQSNSQIFQASAGGGTKKISFFGATAQPQFTAITAPTGGVVIDAEARTAIGSILTLLGAGTSGYGLTT